MLKFQDNHTTTIETFEDFILIIFVIIDELYKLYIPISISNRRNVKYAKLSDSEIITICLCGELLGIDSDIQFHSEHEKSTPTADYLYP